jgi:plastocyanin
VKPIVWIPHFVDNSPSTPLFVTSSTWPTSLQGQLLLTSYGRGTLSLVLIEKVEDLWQGTHQTLPLAFDSGTQHARFHRDGHLYVVGLTSWQSVGHGGAWGSFHRVRTTGRPLRLPTAVATQPGRLELTFSDPLDPASANDAGNLRIRAWTYPWTSRYGTQGQVYSVKTPGKTGADVLAVASTRLSDDGRTLAVEVPELRGSLTSVSVGAQAGLPDLIDVPLGLVVAIDYNLRTADGAELRNVLHKTIHRVPGDDDVHTGDVNRSAGPSASAPPAMTAADHAVHPSPANAVFGRSEAAVSGRPVELRSSGVTLSYDVTEIRAKAGERLLLRYVNASDMVHNLVIVRSEADIAPVGVAALAAHATEWIPADMRDRILAASSLAQPGQTVTVELVAPAPGVYPYICTFSGHFTVMQGRLIVEP